MQKTVFVGLSGGVDSSVAAARLLARGYKVVGVFIKVWHPDFLVCNWEQERLDAMRVAAHLGIPFLTCDGEAAYRDTVAKYFIDSYKAGLTPNPDVMCNQEVKFGAFMRFAMEKGADYVATGHYARKGIETELLRGIDTSKDQSYFLWSLTKDQLSKSLFPIGDTEKTNIREEAAKLNLPTATKKDSQGVCFLGHIDIPDFLSHYIDLKEGDVVNENGTVIGSHKGAFVYTLGQRHGFTLRSNTPDTTPWYITAKDVEKNLLVVGKTAPTINSSDTFTIHNVIWRKDISPNTGDTYEMQSRYRQQPFLVEVVQYVMNENTMELRPKEQTDKPAAGQSCVLYEGEVCLGGGMML